MDTVTSKSLGVDTETSKSPGVDTATARHGYSDALFLLHRILHQKVRNVENVYGKICAFVLVSIFNHKISNHKHQILTHKLDSAGMKANQLKVFAKNEKKIVLE